MAISSGVRRFLVQLRNEALIFDPHTVFTPIPTVAYSIATCRETVPDRHLEEVLCGGSNINIEHEAVSSLARFQPLERFVDAAHPHPPGIRWLNHGLDGAIPMFAWSARRRIHRS
jgi:hypothetical protein